MKEFSRLFSKAFSSEGKADDELKKQTVEGVKQSLSRKHGIREEESSLKENIEEQSPEALAKKEILEKLGRFQKSKNYFEEGIKSERGWLDFTSMQNCSNLLEFAYKDAQEKQLNLHLDDETLVAIGEARGYMDPEFQSIGEFCYWVDFIKRLQSSGDDIKEGKVTFNIVTRLHFWKKDGAIGAMEELTKTGRYRVDESYLQQGREIMEKYSEAVDAYEKEMGMDK